MNQSSNRTVSSLSSQTRTELELLHAVLSAAPVYPWTPHSPDAADYFEALEANWDDQDLSVEALEAQQRALFQQAEAIWSGVEETPPTITMRLLQRFESRMPRDLLLQLASRAQAVAGSGRPLMDKLLACVQDVLADWETEDLQVMARPLAMAMRDGHGEVLEVALRSVRQANWSELSELEQARLSLAIARYALDHVEE